MGQPSGDGVVVAVAVVVSPPAPCSRLPASVLVPGSGRASVAPFTSLSPHYHQGHLSADGSLETSGFKIGVN